MLDKVFDLTSIRKALVLNFGWLIHVSPDQHLESVREKGLIANRDVGIPDELKGLVPSSHILCLHPLGAKICPLPVCKSAEESSDIDLVTFAVANEDFPRRVHTDWSNAWDFQSGRIELYRSEGVDWLARHLVTEFGSVVSYDRIEPEKLRVFCANRPPADPSRWPRLVEVKDEMIHRYKKPR
jgi:hypothetical protein